MHNYSQENFMNSKKSRNHIIKSSSTTDLKSLYTDFIKRHNVNAYAFGVSVQRFNADRKRGCVEKIQHLKKNEYHKGSLDGGLGKFLTTQEDKCNKNFNNGNIQRKVRKTVSSERVINPGLNTDERDLKISQRRFNIEGLGRFRNLTNGSYESLLMRTPATFPIKGRKKIIQSFKGLKNGEHNVFSEEFLCGKSQSELQGEQRKLNRKVHSQEKYPILTNIQEKNVEMD